ncbi:molybdenum ABC transporter ATP-binding protein [Teredinibacter franksiae]|uniref:molybdenum ABC transporter ATP-binding protein n=1 Tax=Teredinibacter franksiae TaxID=2761453 RepID=UPI001C895F57|nr:molybdenum ABC transporter ATP-binding protein [Teredinibacter franksiae]
MNTSTKNDLRLNYTLHKNYFESTINLSIPCRGTTAIFGASGSGKTTMLRSIAGLENTVRGTIQFREQVFQNEKTFLPVHKRPIGYVFQQPGLFPHLTVLKNLLYGYKRINPAERTITFDDAVQLLGVENLLKRFPHQLSGGQQQRVGIARALLTSPKLLLMDEPLASLDQRSKTEILPYLDHLHRRLEIPILYVSHAIEEVVRIADRMILMDKGAVIAEGELNALLTDNNLPLTDLEEACVVTDGRVKCHLPEYHLTQLKTDYGDLVVSQKDLQPDSCVRIRILARDVSLALDLAERSSISNILPVIVDQITDTPDPAQVLVKLKAKTTPMLSRITRRSLSHLNLAPGQQVYAQIKSVSLMKDNL